MQKSKNIIKKSIIIGALTVLLVVLLLLKNSTAVCDFFAMTIARGWIWLVGNLFGWIPVSFFEIFLIVGISGLIAILVVLLKRLFQKKFAKALSLLLTVVIVALSGVNLYTATATFSYNRSDLPKDILTWRTTEDVTYDEALEIAKHIVKEVNDCYVETRHDTNGNIILPSFAELNQMLTVEYARLDNGYFSPYTPNCKQIMNKRIMSELHITGVFFAPFGEANVNGNEMRLFAPLTMAHELAHSKGVMRESDATVVASYLLLSSDNSYLRYGALVDCLSDALNLLALYPESQSDRQYLNDLVDDRIWTERSNYYNYYRQFTLLDDIGNFFNDIYLKLQGQQGGVDSYVRPPEMSSPGGVGDDGVVIPPVYTLSDMQNMLVGLYRSCSLAS